MKTMSLYTHNNQRLDSVNRFLRTHAQWAPLVSSGTTNHLFQAVIDNKKYVLRLNAEDHLAFGVSRKTEADILELIKDYSWAPQVIQNNWHEGWCLMLDHGPTIDTELPTADHQEMGSALLEAISEWQLIRPDSQLHNQCAFDYARLFEKYRSALKAPSDKASSHDNLRLINNVENKLNTLPSTPQCLTHHDLHSGNICKDNNQFVILDWEYAGIGNPWFDAAALKNKFGILDADIAVLPAFKHLSRVQIKQGITGAVWLAEALESLWLAVRSND